MKRVFIVHGWSSNPEDAWFPWLKNELEARGFSVSVPAMPNPDEPKIEDWIARLSDTVGRLDKETFFIGHSIGCQAILRYLSALGDVQVGGVVCIAGWFHLMNIETRDEENIAGPWLEMTIDFERVRKVAKKITAIFSDDDPVVPLESNKKDFEEKLNAKIIVEERKGHYGREDGMTTLPAALEAVLQMSKE